MADSNNLMNNVQQLQQATMSPNVIKASGAGKAYQSVAQSTAIAVQDATDTLRNLSTISSTAIGAAMAQMLADPKNASKYQQVITQAQDIMTQAAATFQTIGQDAATVLNGFPSN